MTLLLLVTGETMLLEQLQHILGPYLEELFCNGPEEQSTADLVSEQTLKPESGKFLPPFVSINIWMGEILAYGPVKLLTQVVVLVCFCSW